MISTSLLEPIFIPRKKAFRQFIQSLLIDSPNGVTIRELTIKASGWRDISESSVRNMVIYMVRTGRVEQQEFGGKHPHLFFWHEGTPSIKIVRAKDVKPLPPRPPTPWWGVPAEYLTGAIA